MNNRYEKFNKAKKIFATTFLFAEIIFFSALPVVAFELSGFGVKGDNGEKKSASADASPDVITDSIDSYQNENILKIGSVKGIVNTGINLSGIGHAATEAVMAPWQTPVYDEQRFIDGEYVEQKYVEPLIELAKTDTRVANVLANADLYPQEFLEMLAKYPETVTFVSDYLYCRYNQVADNVGDVTEGEIPLLLQWDERWGYAAYGDGYIGNGGCGPTSLSMVIVGLTGDNTVTPKVVADYAAENGYYVSGAGSSWTLMSEGAKYFGVDGVIMSFSRDEIYRALEEGHPIICSVGAGDFTTEGHFIVLSGIKDDKICVNDPNSSVNSGKLWTYEELAPQIRNLWEFSLSE